MRLGADRALEVKSVAALAAIIASCSTPLRVSAPLAEERPAPPPRSVDGTCASSSPSSPPGDATAEGCPAEPTSPAPTASSAPPLVASTPPPAPSASAGTRVLTDAGRPLALAEPPEGPIARAPVVTFLHGMCASPEWECPVFRSAARSAWLLCPRGPAPCQGDGAMWVGLPRALAARVELATEALVAEEAGHVDTARRALVGYSLGAFAAMNVLAERPAVYSRLMLVNAAISPSKLQLTRAGIARVALVAGERDASATGMKATAAALTEAGLEVRFYALPATGHYFDPTTEEKLAEPMTWLLEGL